MIDLLDLNATEVFTYKPFLTLQGEGINAGLPTTLIRFGKCNLRCNFCDASYNWNANFVMTIKDLLPFIQKNILFTGGEPLISNYRQQFMYSTIIHFENMTNLKGIYEIETNGTNYIQEYLAEVLTSINISPKESRYQLQNYKPSYKLLEQLDIISNKYIVKFVFDNTEENKQFILNLIDRYKIDTNKVFIMPKGETIEEILQVFEPAIDFAMQNNFRFTPRQHIMLFKPNYSKWANND